MISSSVILESCNLSLVPFQSKFDKSIISAFNSPEITEFFALSPEQIKEFVTSLNEVQYYPQVGSTALPITLPRPTELNKPWNQFIISQKHSLCENHYQSEFNSMDENDERIHILMESIDDECLIPKEVVDLWWCIMDKKTENFAGMAGFNLINHKHRKAEYVFWIFPEYRGNGFLTEALYGLTYYGFKYLNLHRIESYVIDQNKSCERAFLKTPFKFEGVLHDFEIVNNQYVSYNLYGLVNPTH